MAALGSTLVDEVVEAWRGELRHQDRKDPVLLGTSLNPGNGASLSALGLWPLSPASEHQKGEPGGLKISSVLL